MSPIAVQVEEALRLAGAVVSTAAATELWRARKDPPWSWVVVGRRSVGKSRLINALVASRAPTGMGGVTVEVARYPGDRLALVDTPGLEHELDGADCIEAVLPTVDGVLWVVDGLQPLTGLERAAVDRAVPAQVPVVAAVSRMDLVDADEHEAVLDRVRGLLAQRSLHAVLPAHPKADPEPLRQALEGADPLRSPARRSALHAALVDVRAALTHLARASGPDPADLAHEAAEAWRLRVHEAEQDVAAMVRDATVVFRDEALQALHTRLLSAADRVRDELRSSLGEAPSWHPDPPDLLDLRGQVRDLVGGARRVLHGLSVGAAAWADAGAAAFEGAVELPGPRAMRARQQRVDAALVAVGRAVDLLG